MNLKDVKEKVVNSLNLGLIEESDDYLTFENYRNGHIVTMVNNLLIDDNWFVSKCWINKKFQHRYNLNCKEIGNACISMMGVNHLQSLEKIYFIYQLSDFDKIAKLNQETLPECYQEFWTDEVGLMWHDKNSVFINLRIIEKYCKHNNVFSMDVLDEFQAEILMTLFHELKHLKNDNPIYQSIFRMFDEEGFVEDFSRRLYETYQKTICQGRFLQPSYLEFF